MNKKLMKKLHLWLSLPLGIVFFLFCITGAPLVFKSEIRQALGMPHVVGSHHGNRKLQANETTKKDFLSHLQQFHKSLLLGKTGKCIVTYSTLACTLILITGLAESWPNQRKQWRARFTINHRKGKNRFWYDLHVSLGYWLVLWLILLCLTGVAIGLHLYGDNKGLMRLTLDLHTGRWGGTITKIITFVVALLGATLPLTGYYLFIKRQLKREQL